MTALLVEDLEEPREMYSYHLRQHNIRVLEADSRESAIRIYKQWGSQISLVLTDWRLVDSDENDNGGVDLANDIRQLDPDQNIYCMTAYHRPEEVKDLRVFNGLYEKAPTNDRNGFLYNLPNIINYSEESLKRKQKNIPKYLLNLKEKYRITDDDFHYLIQNRPLTPDMEKALLSFHFSNDYDQKDKDDNNVLISETPYILPIADPNIPGSEDLKNPLIVIVKTVADYVITELYGHPMVYTYGETIEDSLIILIELLKEYHSEMNKDITYASSDIVKFSTYLEELFGVKYK